MPNNEETEPTAPDGRSCAQTAGFVTCPTTISVTRRAMRASRRDLNWFAKRGCRLAPKAGQLERSQPLCSGGEHAVRPIVVQHARFERAEA